MTAAPAPATIFNDLLDEAIGLTGKLPVNEFAIRAFERQVATLAKVDAPGAMELRTHLDMLRGDRSGAEEQFRKALKISDNKTDTIMRFIQLLGMWGASQQVARIVDEFWNQIRNDPSSVKSVRSVFTRTGWVDRAQKCEEDLERLKATVDFGPRCVVDHGDMIEKDIALPVEFSHSYVQAHNLLADSIRTTVVPFEEGVSSLMYEMAVQLEPDRAAELEWGLLEALGKEEFQAVERGLLVVSLMPAQGGAKSEDVCHV